MRRRERLLIALAGAGAVAVIAYATARAMERLLFSEPNLSTVISSERSGFVWRSLIALYCGGISSFGGYALASRAPRASARWLGVVIGVAAVTIALQAVIAP
jgi:hypothetical protein